MSPTPRILAVTAGTFSKRSAIASALHDIYNAEILPGKSFPESRVDRLLNFIGLGNVRANISLLNTEILGRAGGFDVLFVVKGNFVTRSTLAKLKSLRFPPRIVGWSCDDVFLGHNNSEILKKAASLYDIFYTAKSLNISNGELTAMGFPRARFLPQGFDRDVHRPFPVKDSRFAGKVVFVGYGETDRFEKMNYLARNGVEVHVWGNGWTSAMRRKAHALLRIHGEALIGDDYADALSNAAISLCFLRKINRDLHTSRTFEIPACGGFMLAERTEEHRRYFEEDVEAVYFSDAEELLEKTRRYLEDEAGRDRIAAAGRRRCLDSDYSYHALARQMISEVCEL